MPVITTVKKHREGTAKTAEPLPPNVKPFSTEWKPGALSKTGSPTPTGSALQRLDFRRISLENPPVKPVATYSLEGQQICTAGNLTGVAAQVKSGKSALIGGILASALIGDTTPAPDCLGFEASPHGGKAVILFDTEQSPYDAWQLVRRSATRAGVDSLPANFRAYRLLDVPTAERRQMLSIEMERAHEECGGIHSVLVDGIADLCADPNNPEEAFGLVDELIQLAVKYDCPIVAVLHENPTSLKADYAKTRGHLGSQLERKAESNLRLVKDADGISSLYSEKCRSANIPKNRAIRFQWSEADGMHMRVTEGAGDGQRIRRIEEHLPAVEAVFDASTGPVPYSDLIKRLESKAGLKGRTAERRISTWSGLGIIKKTPSGYLVA